MKLPIAVLVFLLSKLIYAQNIANTDICPLLNIDNKLSKECQNQLKVVCKSEKLWFKFWDASTRDIHTGLTATNNLDLGNYDACLAINYSEDDRVIRGKHCPLSYVTQIIIPEEVWREKVGPNEKYQSYPNVTIKGSMCIPDACSSKEYDYATKHTRLFPHMVTEIIISECYTTDTRRNLIASDVIVLLVLAVLTLTLILCTTYDVLYNDSPLIVKAFSVYYNGKKLLTINDNKVDQIQCMNGIRFLCMSWIIAGHGFVSWKTLPHFNQKDADEWASRLYSQYINSAVYAVDTFFFLSGFLAAYIYLRAAHKLRLKKQILGIPLMYLHRYLRITPAVAALFFIATTVFPLMGDGPIWFKYNDVITKPCYTYWWRYFTYTANYFDSSDLCFVHTWYLSADMQMFILSPLVLIPTCVLLHRKFTNIIYGISTLAVFTVCFSIAINYAFGYKNEYDSHSRFSDYLIGMIGGICFYKYKGKKIKINKWLNISLWIVCFLVMIFLALYLYDVLNYPTKDKHILFYNLYRPLWSLCNLWIVLSCYFGYGGFINWFLSLPVFQIGARLSYSMYIVHALVVLYQVARVRTYMYFDDYILYYWWCGHLITCLIVSLIWTFAFESPMITIEKIIFSSGKRKNTQPIQKTEEA